MFYRANIMSLQAVPTFALPDNTGEGGPQHDVHLYTLASSYANPPRCTHRSACNISYQFELVQLGLPSSLSA